jgi:hypothetical protein
LDVFLFLKYLCYGILMRMSTVEEHLDDAAPPEEEEGPDILYLVANYGPERGGFHDSPYGSKDAWELMRRY